MPHPSARFSASARFSLGKETTIFWTIFCPMLLGCNSQKAVGVLSSHPVHRHSKTSTMLRTAAVHFMAEGRLLGFDVGDWLMLVGGFSLAGLLALVV